MTDHDAHADERPFLEMFHRMMAERGGWPGARCDQQLGFRFSAVDDGVAEAEWDASEEQTIPTGTVHGGHIAAVADSVCSVAALSTLEKRGMSAGTLTLSVQFFRYAHPDRLTFRAEVVHRGRKNLFVECQVTDADGRRIASAHASYSRNEPRVG